MFEEDQKYLADSLPSVLYCWSSNRFSLCMNVAVIRTEERLVTFVCAKDMIADSRRGRRVTALNVSEFPAEKTTLSKPLKSASRKCLRHVMRM